MPHDALRCLTLQPGWYYFILESSLYLVPSNTGCLPIDILLDEYAVLRWRRCDSVRDICCSRRGHHAYATAVVAAAPPLGDDEAITVAPPLDYDEAMTRLFRVSLFFEPT